MAEPIQFRRTANAAPVSIPSADGTTAQLLSGEPAVALATGNVTKMWIGDGTNNRLVLSSDLAANPTPLFTQGYLKLTGGTISNPIDYSGTPASGTAGENELVNRKYVDQAVASGQQRIGAYRADTNVPVLNPPSPTPANGQFFDVSHSGNAVPGIPGINAGDPINAGARLVWNTSIPGFDLIPGGGISQGDADARYVMLTGSTMTSGTITMPAAYMPNAALQVANKGYVDAELATYLPLGGGALAGPGNLTMTGSLSVALTTTLTGNVTVGAGSSITMPTGYAPTGLQVATVSSITAQLADYLPLIGGALTGNLSTTGNISVTGTSTLTGNVTAGAGLLIGNPTGGMQGAGSINAQSIYLNGVAMTIGVDGGTFAG